MGLIEYAQLFRQTEASPGGECLTVNGVQHIPWNHPSNNPDIIARFEHTNSADVAHQLDSMAPVTAAIDSLKATTITTDVADHYKDLLSPLSKDVTIAGSDFTTWFPEANEEEQGKAQKFQKLAESMGFSFGFGGIPAVITLKGFNTLCKKGIMVNNGRTQCIAFLTSLMSGGIGMGVGFEILGDLTHDYQNKIIAAETSCNGQDPTMQYADTHMDPNQFEMTARTAIIQWKMQNLPDAFLIDRGVEPGRRAVVLGSAHYYPTPWEESMRSIPDITALRDEVIAKEASLLIANNIPNDQAIEHLTDLLFQMGTVLLLRMRNTDGQLFHIPLSDSSGKYIYCDPVLLPELQGVGDHSQGIKRLKVTMSQFYENFKSVM